jgi:hypothetical protein
MKKERNQSASFHFANNLESSFSGSPLKRTAHNFPFSVISSIVPKQVKTTATYKAGIAKNKE